MDSEIEIYDPVEILARIFLGAAEKKLEGHLSRSGCSGRYSH
jgi:hypothetical protein